MGEDQKIDDVESIEAKVPEIENYLQAIGSIGNGFKWFFKNHPKKTIFGFVALFAVALILYNNINILKEIYNLVPSQ